jgi:hypothetical protein
VVRRGGTRQSCVSGRCGWSPRSAISTSRSGRRWARSRDCSASARPRAAHRRANREIPPVEGICIALTTFAIVAGMSASEAGPIGNAVPHVMVLPPHESLTLASVSIPETNQRSHGAAPSNADSVRRPGDQIPTARWGRSSAQDVPAIVVAKHSFGACREEREVGCDGKHLRTPDRGRDYSQSVPDVPPGTSWRRASHGGHPPSLDGPALHT